MTKKIKKKYIKEKYKVTKKKSQGNEIITSLSSEETNNRNNIKKKINMKIKKMIKRQKENIQKKK